MANRRSFKSDTSFLEKISIGAMGTRQVYKDLKENGHMPIELERSSMSNKIWKKIKIKRIRVPDILCVHCGLRIESRAKTSFEISMSHSLSDPERGWDFGFENKDFIAFVTCSKSGDRPIDWEADKHIQYVSVQDLRDAYKKGLGLVSTPKGAQEGFEARISWPSAIANYDGIVESIANNKLQYLRDPDKRKVTLALTRSKVILNPLVSVGERIIKNQVLASVVAVQKRIDCANDKDQNYYLARLSNRLLSERYAAAKALFAFPSKDVIISLITKLNESDEHIYVKLEAAASLARLKDDSGWKFIIQCLDDEYVQNRLEAVISLGEIHDEKSFNILRDVLRDNEQYPEIRAEAAWALGELRNKLAVDVLIESFSEVNEDIKIEAARALGKLATQFTSEIIEKFPRTNQNQRPGIAWALSKSKNVEIKNLINALVDEDARHWISYIIGTQDPRKYIDEINMLKEKDPQVYFAVTVLWKIMTSWVYELEEY